MRNKIAKWALILILSCGIMAGFEYFILDGISRQQAFNENVRQTRCDHHWIPGYCKGLVRKS